MKRKYKSLNYYVSVKYLGVVKADPEEYSRLYGPELKSVDELPHDIRDIKYPDELLEEMKSSKMLEGDVEALKLVDMIFGEIFFS